MAVANSVARWTTSAREILDLFQKIDSGTYLPITLSAIGRAWKLPLWEEDDIDGAFGDPSAVLTDLRGYLAVSPNDVAVRWTVLAFLYDLCEEPDDDDDNDEWEGDSWSEEERAPFREELSALVSLPEIARINDSARARWEIHNSCLIEDFERAVALFRRVQEIEPATAAMNCARQGEFHLLRATSADPDDIGNAAFRLAPPATALATTLARWSVAVDVDDGQDEAGVNEARYWFEKAVKGGVSLPQHHACALARCFFVEKNYQRAAVLFETSLGLGGIRLEGEKAAFNDELNAALHLAIARSHELAGEPTKARDVLARCLDTFPKYGPGYRRLAELAITLQADYREAYEVLVRWSEAEPELATDIWVRTLRGLGAPRRASPSDACLTSSSMPIPIA